MTLLPADRVGAARRVEPTTLRFWLNSVVRRAITIPIMQPDTNGAIAFRLPLCALQPILHPSNITRAAGALLDNPAPGKETVGGSRGP